MQQAPALRVRGRQSEVLRLSQGGRYGGCQAQAMPHDGMPGEEGCVRWCVIVVLMVGVMRAERKAGLENQLGGTVLHRGTVSFTVAHPVSLVLPSCASNLEWISSFRSLFRGLDI